MKQINLFSFFYLNKDKQLISMQAMPVWYRVELELFTIFKQQKRINFVALEKKIMKYQVKSPNFAVIFGANALC